MAKIGASGKNILRGRSPWLGVPRAGVGGLGAIGPNGNYPDAEGNTTCPEVNGMSNPYNYKGYFLPPGKACIHDKRARELYGSRLDSGRVHDSYG